MYFRARVDGIRPPSYHLDCAVHVSKKREVPFGITVTDGGIDCGRWCKSFPDHAQRLVIVLSRTRT